MYLGSGVWFSHATPKFAFMTWLAIHDRLSTMDKVSLWSRGVDPTCVLCKKASESRDHLFFECTFSSQIWEQLVKGILCSSYTTSWSDIVGLITGRTLEKKALFCVRYTFQATLHAIWRERNKITHGDSPLPLVSLKKLIDKGVRNKLSLIRRKGVKNMEGILQFWFDTRM